MVPGLFHINVYYMLLYFLHHIVQGMLQAWDPQAFQELEYVLISHPHQGSRGLGAPLDSKDSPAGRRCGNPDEGFWPGMPAPAHARGTLPVCQ